ncbi:hypothetical protein Ciccas_001244 [Cichlidogyrus casuarinus]|uniref:Uncharacterized protein n=1 Tax=Cichlidogyrus casuarinus TaxID=1844966 RepID=A0ABD2QKN1_9PLAT
MEKKLHYSDMNSLDVDYPPSCCPGVSAEQPATCAQKNNQVLPFVDGCAQKVLKQIFSLNTIPLPLMGIPFFVVHSIMLILGSIVIYMDSKKEMVFSYARFE